MGLWFVVVVRTVVVCRAETCRLGLAAGWLVLGVGTSAFRRCQYYVNELSARAMATFRRLWVCLRTIRMKKSSTFLLHFQSGSSAALAYKAKCFFAVRLPCAWDIAVASAPWRSSVQTSISIVEFSSLKLQPVIVAPLDVVDVAVVKVIPLLTIMANVLVV